MRALLLPWIAALVACGRAEVIPLPSPDPVVVADAGPSPGGEAPARPPSPWCSPAEQIVEVGREDLAWARRVTDEMARGISRKRLVCLFGEPVQGGGGLLGLRPWSRAFARAFAGMNVEGGYRAESIRVTFAEGAKPRLESVERALGPSEISDGHLDTPIRRTVVMPAPEGVSVRAFLTMDEEDRGRVRVRDLHLDMSDIRGWTPPPLRPCVSRADLQVAPPSGDRFPAGEYVLSVRRSGAAPLRFACTVPADILDVGRCSPPGKEPPGAEVEPAAFRIGLHVPGTAKEMTIDVQHDGALVGSRTVHPTYFPGPDYVEPSKTCTTALELVTFQ